MVETPCWSRRRSPSLGRKEQQRQCVVIIIPIPCPPHAVREKIKNRIEPRKKGGVEEVVLIFSFYFSLSYSNLIGNIFSKFLQAMSAFPMTWNENGKVVSFLPSNAGKKLQFIHTL